MKIVVEISVVEIAQALLEYAAANHDVLKSAVRAYALKSGVDLDASSQFALNSDNSITITTTVTEPVPGPIPAPIPTPSPVPAPVPAPPVVPITPPGDRARCDLFTTQFTFPAECAYANGSAQRIPEDVVSENVPGDNGGLTKWGIDAGGHPQLSADYIENMTEQQALDQYYITWTAQLCGKLPYPLGEVIHDTFESGGKPIRWLQETLNEPDPAHAIHWLQSVLAVKVDGLLGPMTLGAVEAVSNPKQLCHDFLVYRDAYFNALADKIPHDAQFRQGWLNRDINLRAYLGV